MIDLSKLSWLSIFDNRVASVADLNSGSFTGLGVNLGENCITDLDTINGNLNVVLEGYTSPTSKQYTDCNKNAARVTLFRASISPSGEYRLLYRATHNPSAVCTIEWGDGQIETARCDAKPHARSHVYAMTPAEPVIFKINGIEAGRATYNYIDSTGLVAHWSFDDCTAKDSSSANNSGVLIASPGCVTGVLGKAIDLNTTNYAEILDSNSLDVSTAFTLSAWFNGRSLGSQSSEQRPFRLIDKVTAGSGDGYLLDVWAGGIRFGSGSNETIAYTPVSENTFHHVAGIFSQGKASIYLDEKLVISTTTTTTDTPINTFPVRIGASQGSGAIQTDNFNGLIDDVRIYNRALSETEIQTLYQQGGGNVDNTGWILNPTTGHYYKALDNCGNWEQCETAAQAVGAHLVVIEDQAENDWVANTFNVAAVTYGYWIGYTDKEQEGVWKTVAGEIATYTNWFLGEPNDYYACIQGEDYAHISGTTGGWNDLNFEDNCNGGYSLKSGIIERTTTPTGNANPFTVQAADETGTAFTVPAGKTQCTFTATGTWGESVSSSTYDASGAIGWYVSYAALPSSPIGH
ncbi:MAG: lectin-like protein [Candidatus Thiothrix putei]|uniref:Lectin-like protein n=1 Tax=Candidatus Thiothrix putei TaxID=3080811 RepID=A0AA95KRF5_9GAMM|nr:MAG: lectin-like protein [Candidatus Thiothrix putei]